jgi:hypothetical protein
MDVINVLANGVAFGCTGLFTTDGSLNKPRVRNWACRLPRHELKTFIWDRVQGLSAAVEDDGLNAGMALRFWVY